MKKNLNPLLESADDAPIGGAIGGAIGGVTPYVIRTIYHKLVTQPRIRKELSTMLYGMTIPQLNSELKDLLRFFSKCLKYDFPQETIQWLKKVIKFTKKVLVSKNRELKIQFIYYAAIEWEIPSKSCNAIMSEYDGRMNPATRFLLFVSSGLTSLAAGAAGYVMANNM
jgi:hypothetical protein